MRYCLAVLLLAFCACSSGPKYQKRIDQNVGSSIDLIISESGAPTSIIPLSNGDKVYTWHQDVARHNSGLLYGGRATTDFCNTLYTVDNDGLIKKANYQGKDCKAR